MHKALLEILVDPVSKMPFYTKEQKVGQDGTIIEGSLHSSEGSSYAITHGIPRFVLTEDTDQKQTQHSFGFKWQQRNSYDSPQMRLTAQQWLVKRYGFNSIEQMRTFFGSRQRILDAGCGSGFSSSLWLNSAWQGAGKAAWIGTDISAAIDVAQERLASIPGTSFVQADILQLPFREHVFDTIFSEGVLHHTPSTEKAFKALVTLLAPAGEFLFYVYRKKAPIREFTDDYVRDIISAMPPEEAWNMLRPLTQLGQALSNLQAEVEVAEDIPYLGIKAGRYDVQRLIYWHFAKLYWNETFDFEENHHVNFDWYHPRYAHRQTEMDIRRWCDETAMTIIHFDTEESGFTVRAVKN